MGSEIRGSPPVKQVARGPVLIDSPRKRLHHCRNLSAPRTGFGCVTAAPNCIPIFLRRASVRVSVSPNLTRLTAREGSGFNVKKIFGPGSAAPLLHPGTRKAKGH